MPFEIALPAQEAVLVRGGFDRGAAQQESELFRQLDGLFTFLPDETWFRNAKDINEVKFQDDEAVGV